MFAREQKNEYDPMASPMIERPLASGRSFNAQKNGAKSFEAGAAQENGGEPSLRSPAKMAGRASMPNPAAPPTKKTHSPSKSSFSSKSRYAQAQAFDPESGIWSDEEDSITDRQLPPGKSLHRHAKSVTFDVAPPQINEYEMTTPDPSSVASGSREGSHDSTEEEDESFDRGSSIDREDSFDPSLEDVEKTPVVLPEDWRFMSPDSANEELTARFEDPFAGIHGSPQPTTQASMAVDARLTPIRTDSADSNGERRPLPPLPPSGLPHSSHKRTDSRNNLSATVERFDSAQHSAATPPGPASVTKSEIQGMSGCAMSLEERLKLMMLDDEKSPKDQADEQRERRLRRGSPARNIPSQIASQSPDHKDELEGDDIAELEDYSLPPRISRESILRNVRDKAKEQKAQDERTSSSLTLRFGNDISSIDPDVPLPTTEDTDGPQSFIKQELDEQSEVDVYAIPDLYSEHLQTESFVSAMDKLEAIKKSQEQETWDSIGSEKDDDEESQYSVDSKPDAHVDQQSVPLEEDEGPPTPKISDNQLQPDRKENHRMSLPQFAALLGNRDFDFGMESFMSDAPHSPAENYKAQANITSSWESAYSKGVIERKAEIERPKTPEMQLNPPKLPAYDSGSFEEAGTPDSVVRHKISNSPPEPPSVPALAATIKSSNGKLKTRQSATPTDLQAMAMVRRQVSGEESEVPAVPKIPFEHQSQPSAEQPEQVSAGVKTEGNLSQTNAIVDEARQPKRKSSLTPLDLRVEREEGLGIESEFDRLIEAQKVEYLSRDLTLQAPYWSPGYAEYMGGQGFRPTEDFGANRSSRTQKGYLMRQNTKVIVASSASHDSDVDPKDVKDGLSTDVRGTRSAGNSPRKGSHTTWTTEPWNGKVRRKSIRKSGGLPSKPAAGPAPPLPGQQSNVASSLDSVDEDEALGQVEEIGEDGERGRLFVKVVRVKDLDLPLPRGQSSSSMRSCYSLNTGERSYFALTLDNGLHCVTTSWLELGKTAPIGQEFELVVLNDLEFQLTLQTKIEEPQPKPVLESPTKAAKAAKSSAFSRVFASPRKRKEMELKQQEEAQRADRQRQQDLQASKRAAQPTAWELLHNLVAQDGSFARAYVCLKDHESSAYGKQFTVDVPCFNEWATEESHNGSSARSKRTGAILRKAPYRVGKLELHLFYVPKPKGSSDEEMPKSMSGCIRELREAQQAGPTKWEGHLSQQGGDCPVSPRSSE